MAIKGKDFTAILSCIPGNDQVGKTDSVQAVFQTFELELHALIYMRLSVKR